MAESKISEMYRTPAEWRVMQVCWHLGRATTQATLLEVAEQASSQGHPQLNVHLQRMVAKAT